MVIHNYDGLDNIYYLDIFEKELRKIKKDNPNYSKWLDRKIKILSRDAAGATDGKTFEKLSGQQLYSIRHPSKNNERVIYYIIDDDNSVILLTAFCERNKSDYQHSIAISKQRLKALETEL